MADAASAPLARATVGRSDRPSVRSGTVALVSALVLYLGLTGILLWLSLARTGGEFVYAQDDPYIHLAMGRTLAEHGVWGVRSDEFASASSSPLWTALLAALWKAGLHQTWTPFALNLAFGCGLLVYVSRQLQSLSPMIDADLSPRVNVPPIAVLMALVLVTPLPTLAFIGMEHSLHVLLAVVFGWQSAVRLAGERDDWATLSIITALMVATRYESLFLVAVVGATLIWNGRWRAAAMLGTAAAMPILAFACYSVAHGGLVLPNSVLMKSGPARFATVGTGISAVLLDWLSIRALFQRPALLALTIGVLVALLLVPARRLSRQSSPVWLSGLFLGGVVLHACLVKIDWFFRYDAYLMALGLVSVRAVLPLVVWPQGVSRRQRAAWHPAILPLVAVLSLPLALRGLGAGATTVAAIGNVFDQQVQLGRFFARYYPAGSIAINDLGAVAWLSSSRILDVVGLASQQVADLKRQQAFNEDALVRLSAEKGVEAVAVYEDIFADVLPSDWVKVGQWTIRGNVAVAGETVSFFTPDRRSAGRLEHSLNAFSEQLPPGVVWVATQARIPKSHRVKLTQP